MNGNIHSFFNHNLGLQDTGGVTHSSKRLLCYAELQQHAYVFSHTSVPSFTYSDWILKEICIHSAVVSVITSTRITVYLNNV